MLKAFTVVAMNFWRKNKYLLDYYPMLPCHGAGSGAFVAQQISGTRSLAGCLRKDRGVQGEEEGQ